MLDRVCVAARHLEGVHTPRHIHGPGFVFATSAERLDQSHDVTARGEIENGSVACHIDAIDRGHDPRQPGNLRRLEPHLGVRIERVWATVAHTADQGRHRQTSDDRARGENLEGAVASLNHARQYTRSRVENRPPQVAFQPRLLNIFCRRR